MPLELDITGWAQETRIMGLLGQEKKFDDIFSRFDAIRLVRAPGLKE